MPIALTIAAREFKSLFLSPLAWTVLAVLQGLLAYLFLAQVETFFVLMPKLATVDSAPGLTDIAVTPLYGNAGIMLLLVTPLLTMRLVCEERRNKTLALLLSAPVSAADIIVGKYLGSLYLLLLMVAMLTLMPLSLLLGGTLDMGKLWANVLALSLLVSAFAAAGLYFSTVASHPTVAAMAAFGLLLLLWVLDWSSTLQDQRSALYEYLSLLRHFQNLQSGLLDTADIGYFLVFILLFLMLSVQSLAKERLP
ncbi:MAG: ABC transporter permease subunit [Methylococcaceae bacterium]|nr:ABC transporter permease subunit [Methylococcaceae bacterium]